MCPLGSMWSSEWSVEIQQPLASAAIRPASGTLQVLLSWPVRVKRAIRVRVGDEGEPISAQMTPAPAATYWRELFGLRQSTRVSPVRASMRLSVPQT